MKIKEGSMLLREITSVPFKKGDRVYHVGRRQEGTFIRYDDRNTPTNNNGWVMFEEDDEELMVSLEKLRLA